MLKKIGRFLWILLAVGCLVIAIRHYEDIGRSTTKEGFIYSLALLFFWVFIILGIGSKKGVPFAFGVVTFVACSFGFLYLVNWLPKFYGCAGLKNDLRSFNACAERAFQFKPFRAYGALGAAALALLAIPFLTAFVGRGAHRIMKIDRPKTVPAPVPVLPSGGRPKRSPRGWRGPGGGPP